MRDRMKRQVIGSNLLVLDSRVEDFRVMDIVTGS